MEARVEASRLKPAQLSCPLTECSQMARSKQELGASQALGWVGPAIAWMGPSSVSFTWTPSTQRSSSVAGRGEAEKQQKRLKLPQQGKGHVPLPFILLSCP